MDAWPFHRPCAVSNANKHHIKLLQRNIPNSRCDGPVVFDAPRPRGKHTVGWCRPTECGEVASVSALRQTAPQIYKQAATLLVARGRIAAAP